MKKILLWGGVLLLPLLLFSQIPYQAGWPVEISEHYSSSLFIADVNDDGLKDLVFSGLPNNFQPSKLYVMNQDGSNLSGYPIDGGIVFTGIPALSDLDDDGMIDIVWSEKDLHRYDSSGNEIWTIPYSGPVFQSTYYPYHVSVDDLDNDGIKEIVVTCYSGGAVFVFEPDGTVRPGWPVVFPPPCPTCSPPPIATPASIGDMDGDGSKEIIVLLDSGADLYCLKPDGSVCPGFPVDTIQNNNGQAVLADVDDDTFLEILFVNDAYFHIFNHDGTVFPGFPIFGYLANSGASIMYENGEFVVGFSAASVSDWQIYLYRLSPVEILTGWPSVTPGWNFDNIVIFADMDDTSDQEIVCGARSNAFVPDGRLYAYFKNGSIVSDFPSNDLFHRGLRAGGAIHDLDGDGDLELCYGSKNDEFTVPRSSTVFCWDIDHPYNLDNIDWAMDGFDLGHTGRWRKLYHIDRVNSSLTVEGCALSPCTLVADGGLRQVTVIATRQADGTHPTGQDVRFSRTLGCGEYEGPVVDNGDGTYTRLLRAPTTDCTTDIHAWVNEFKLQDGVVVTFATCTADLGDVNLNTFITSLDASLVLQNVVGLTPFDDFEACRADVNENGNITSLDAAYILMCTVGNCPDLPNVNFQTSCQSHGNCL